MTPITIPVFHLSKPSIGIEYGLATIQPESFTSLLFATQSIPLVISRPKLQENLCFTHRIIWSTSQTLWTFETLQESSSSENSGDCFNGLKPFQDHPEIREDIMNTLQLYFWIPFLSFPCFCFWRTLWKKTHWWDQLLPPSFETPWKEYGQDLHFLCSKHVLLPQSPLQLFQKSSYQEQDLCVQIDGSVVVSVMIIQQTINPFCHLQQ